jgi:hypothetical protein
LDDPKVELITEIIRRRQPKKGMHRWCALKWVFWHGFFFWNGLAVGIVSTAYGQDATPAAFVSHTRRRSTYAEITDQIINGVGNWTNAGKLTSWSPLLCILIWFHFFLKSRSWCLVDGWRRIL